MNEALVALGYMEFPEDEVPPVRYWHSQAHLKDWFTSIKQKRRDRSKGLESIPSEEEQDTAGFWTDPDVAGLRG